MCHYDENRIAGACRSVSPQGRGMVRLHLQCAGGEDRGLRTAVPARPSGVDWLGPPSFKTSAAFQDAADHLLLRKTAAISGKAIKTRRKVRAAEQDEDLSVAEVPPPSSFGRQSPKLLSSSCAILTDDHSAHFFKLRYSRSADLAQRLMSASRAWRSICVNSSAVKSRWSSAFTQSTICDERLAPISAELM
jgi:hypothetical protein